MNDRFFVNICSVLYFKCVSDSCKSFTLNKEYKAESAFKDNLGLFTGFTIIDDNGEEYILRVGDLGTLFVLLGDKDYGKGE